jgi:hypothetical protein
VTVSPGDDRPTEARTAALEVALGVVVAVTDLANVTNVDPGSAARDARYRPTLLAEFQALLLGEGAR